MIDKINKFLSAVLEQYNLSPIKINETECFLLADRYCLYFFIEQREFAIECIYFDRRRQELFSGYNLGLFLVHKRRNKLRFPDKEPDYKSFEEYSISHLEALCNNIRMGASDILIGDKSWQKEYKWPCIIPTKEFLLKFKQHLTRPVER